MRNKTIAFALLVSLFFMWGFMTVILDILVPYCKAKFDLNDAQSMLIQSAFFGAYFLGSLAYYLVSRKTGDPINKIGYKNGIVWGLLISGFGCFLIYPMSFIDSFGMYLIPLFIIGLGFTLLQISANPYASILGSEETASSRLNLAQGFNSLGTTLSPLVGGYFILEYFTGIDALRYPYLIAATLFFTLALLVKRTDMPHFVNSDKIAADQGVFKFRHLKLGMVAIFCYVGAEVAVGSKIIEFGQLPDIMGLSESHASSMLSLYWGGAMIGRFAGAAYFNTDLSQAKKLLWMFLLAGVSFLILLLSVNIKSDLGFNDIYPIWIFITLNFVLFILGRSVPHTSLSLFALAVIALLLTASLGEGEVAFWSLLGVGLFNSIMWSNIFTLAINGLKEYTAQGSSLLVMMIGGGAIIPPLMGSVSDNYGLQLAYLVPVICYVYLMYYGLEGYKIKKT